jgi:AbrB family looped-hinge helix DNA binding protein
VRRRVIKQGASSLTLSIPSDWAKRFNINPGDELEVDDKGNELSIRTEKDFSSKTTTIDISDISRAMMRNMINAVYIRGDDELTILFDKPEQMDIVQDCIDFNIGFAIVEQSKHSCVVKDLSGTTNVEFDNILRRIFYMIMSFAEEGLEIIKKKESLNEFWKRDLAIDKYVYYSLRMLNKKGHPDFSKTHLYYDMVLLLEHLSDEYQRLYKNLKSTNLSPTTIKLFEETNLMFRDFFKLFYKFDKKKANDLVLKKREIRDKVLNFKKADDLLVEYYLRKTVEMIVTILQIQLQLAI